jgi:hypothetical protein
VTAGVANWLRLRAAAGPPAAEPGMAGNEALPAFAVVHVPDQAPDHEADDDGHTIYLDPWAGTADPASPDTPPTSPSPFTASHGPSSLP